MKPNDAIPVVGVELAEEVPISDEDSAPLIGLFWDADAAAATAAAEYKPSAAALKLAGDTPTAEAAAALPYWPQTWARDEKFVIPESCISAAECSNEDAANAVFEATNAALLGELLLLLLLKIGLVFVVGIKTEFWIPLFGGGVLQEVWIGDFCGVIELNVAITHQKGFFNYTILDEIRTLVGIFDTFSRFDLNFKQPRFNLNEIFMNEIVISVDEHWSIFYFQK